VASHEIGTLDLASLEQFQTELIEAGFEPRPGQPRVWVGPIAESLKELTSATTMQIVFVDGWPFRHPHLLVDGLDEWHLSARGDVCLWAPGDSSGTWLTVAGYMHRIEEWAEGAKSGFRPQDFALDAHLSFGKVRAGAIATVDLSSLRLDGARGKIGVISGSWKKNDPVLEIAPGRNGAIEGRWYYVGDVRVPPRSLDGVRALLAPNQQNNFNRRFRAIEKHGKAQLFLIAWDRELGREALVLLAEKRGASVIAEAIEVAPTDAEVLKMRAGPDVDALAGKRVIFFGLGAVGSNAALRVAEVGIGRLIVVDNARLRPGDIVRHAAGAWAVGDDKVGAVRLLIHMRAPWTNVVAIEESPWDPDKITVLLEAADLVVDTTGLASFANLLSVMCAERSLPLLSAALYRGGAVARVRRQALPADTPISDRSDDDDLYPTIPPGDEPRVFEPGCSSPVSNASPIAVAAIAALTADIAIDHLVGRNLYPDEVIDVYRPLEDAPFNRLGRVDA
jgi:molybdopterin/thiamine biosynthesis adenylyltransferase